MNAVTPQAARRDGTAQLNLVRAAFAAVPEGLLLVEKGRVVLVNPSGSKLLGYEDPDLLVGQPVDQFFSHGLFCRDVLHGPFPSQCQHPSCEWVVRRPDQEELRVVVRCTRFRQRDRALILAAFQEARRVEVGRMVRDGQTRFRTIFEAAAIGIGTCTLDGRIIESNPALSKMLGYSAAELVGMHAREFHPGDFEQDEVLLRELTLGSRDCFDLEKRYRRKDGTSLWGHLTVSLVRDSASKPAFLIAMLEDITERKHAAEQLREAEKMEVIGRFAGGIAHDFNNLLTGILLYCDLLLAGLEPGDPMRAHAEEIRMAGEHGAALTQQLLSVARKQAPQPRPVSLNEVISSTENLLRRLIGEQIDLVMIPGRHTGTVLADPGQLRQVLFNLVLNARDAMPNGGRITVSTHARALPGGNDRAASLMVRDTGCGMDVPTQARLFEPFFTTKKPGQGTGLGLATVQRIVKEAGGTIEVESEPGKGTRIEVFLPALKEQAAAELTTASLCAGETILLVDDTASARHSMQRILNQAGYRVLPAANGNRAIEIFAEHQDEVNLLLADWMMPGMSGVELAQTLRRAKPELNVLLISGYHEGGDQPENISVPLVRKPFTGRALIARIRAVLDCKGDASC